MPWFHDPMFAGVMLPPHLTQIGSTASEYTDDNKDIFGKSVQTAPPPKKQETLLKPQVKPDLFEPQ